MKKIVAHLSAPESNEAREYPLAWSLFQKQYGTGIKRFMQLLYFSDQPTRGVLKIIDYATDFRTHVATCYDIYACHVV